MKLGEMKNRPKESFIVVEEWEYPHECGHNVCEDWCSVDDALKRCAEIAESELSNFERLCGVDALVPEQYVDVDGEVGYIITPKNGLDDWYYVARVVKIGRYADKKRG